MSPEAQDLLDAALVLESKGSPFELSMLISYEVWKGFRERAHAYRKSLEPEPRYFVGPYASWFDVLDGHGVTGSHCVIARCYGSADAERIAALLNAAEGGQR